MAEEKGAANGVTHTDLPTYETTTAPQYQTAQWDFIFNYKGFHEGSYVFTNEEDYEKFLAFEKTKGEAQRELVASLQKLGKAMPLFFFKEGGRDKHYIQVYKCLPPPTGIFDKKRDLQLYCVISIKMKLRFANLKLHFTPDPKDHSKDFECPYVQHRREGMYDVAIDGKRFRWLRHINRIRYTNRWTYTLRVLPDDMPSLVDNFDSKGLPVLHKDFHASFFQTYFSNHMITADQFIPKGPIRGQAYDTRTTELTRNDKSAVFSYATVVPPGELTGSIFEVPDDALFFLAQVGAFKRYETELEYLMDRRR